MGHESYEKLKGRLQEAKDVVPTAYYLHYKDGDVYKVIGYCIIEATDEVGIEYFATAEPTVRWIKTLGEWLTPAILEGTEVPRFIRLDD